MMTIYIWVLLFVSFVSFVFHLFHSHPYWFWSFFMYLIYLFSLLISAIIDIWPNKQQQRQKNIKSFISGLYWMIFLVEINDQFVWSSLKWWWFKLVILILKLLLYSKSDIILLVFFHTFDRWWNETKQNHSVWTSNNNNNNKKLFVSVQYQLSNNIFCRFIHLIFFRYKKKWFFFLSTKKNKTTMLLDDGWSWWEVCVNVSKMTSSKRKLGFTNMDHVSYRMIAVFVVDKNNKKQEKDSLDHICPEKASEPERILFLLCQNHNLLFFFTLVLSLLIFFFDSRLSY